MTEYVQVPDNAVVFGVANPTGAVFGWFPIESFDWSNLNTTLHEGCRYVFAEYPAATPEAQVAPQGGGDVASACERKDGTRCIVSDMFRADMCRACEAQLLAIVFPNLQPAAPLSGDVEQVARGSRSLNQIVPSPATYPTPDQGTGADTGPCCAHAYADGWNQCRDATLAALRTQAPGPLGAVKKLPAKWLADAERIGGRIAANAFGKCASELTAALGAKEPSGG